LWAFNEKIVAEAIVKCRVPVVAAIGHETDTTIAELVADERCATPTQAAMRLTPDSGALLRQLDSAGRRLMGLLRRDVQSGRSGIDAAAQRLVSSQALLLQRTGTRIDRLAARLDRQHPGAVHARTIARLHGAAARLAAVVRARVQASDLPALGERLRRAHATLLRTGLARVVALEKQLRSVGPAAVLERGFTVTSTADGKLVRSAREITPGDRVLTRTADGSFESTVSGRAPVRARPRAVGRPGDEPGLFSPSTT
jgi:exodeoxyribonuclease VII large subunit